VALLSGGAVKFVLAAAAALVVCGAGTGVARAEAAPGCSSTVQIGSTAYATFRGQNIASVKQFKGCGLNWAYIYVWQSLRQSGEDYRLTVAVEVNPGPHGAFLGPNETADEPAELWSKGADTLTKCTAAYGMIGLYHFDNYTALTDTRC
jgi:hypothetical protein